MSSQNKSAAGGGASLFWIVSLILGIVIFASLDNKCYEEKAPFKMSTEHIPDVIDRQLDFTWVFVDSNMTENHDLSKFKLQSLMAGIFNPLVGILARTSYPDESSCLNREGKYLGMAKTLMAFQIIDLIIIVLMCCCICGVLAANKD